MATQSPAAGTDTFDKGSVLDEWDKEGPSSYLHRSSVNYSVLKATTWWQSIGKAARGPGWQSPGTILHPKTGEVDTWLARGRAVGSAWGAEGLHGAGV